MQQDLRDAADRMRVYAKEEFARLDFRVLEVVAQTGLTEREACELCGVPWVDPVTVTKDPWSTLERRAAYAGVTVGELQREAAEHSMYVWHARNDNQ